MPTIMPYLSSCVLSICGLVSAVPAYSSLKENNVIVQINSTAGPVTQLFALRTIETDPKNRQSSISLDDDLDNSYDGEEELWLRDPSANTDITYKLADDESQDDGLKFGRALGIGLGLDYMRYAYRPFLQPKRLYDVRIIYAGPSDVFCAILYYKEAVKTRDMRMYGSFLAAKEPLQIGDNPLNFAGGILCVAPKETD